MDAKPREGHHDVCLAQNLYIHEMEDFQHLDRVLYLDIDTLWLDDPRGWWSLIEDMRAQGALFGLAEEGGGWYAGREQQIHLSFSAHWDDALLSCMSGRR